MMTAEHQLPAEAELTTEMRRSVNANFRFAPGVGAGLRMISRLPHCGQMTPSLSNAQRARQVELRVAEALLDAFRTGAVRR